MTFLNCFNFCLVVDLQGIRWSVCMISPFHMPRSVVGGWNLHSSDWLPTLLNLITWSSLLAWSSLHLYQAPHSKPTIQPSHMHPALSPLRLLQSLLIWWHGMARDHLHSPQISQCPYSLLHLARPFPWLQWHSTKNFQSRSFCIFVENKNHGTGVAYPNQTTPPLVSAQKMNGALPRDICCIVLANHSLPLCWLGLAITSFIRVDAFSIIFRQVQT